MDGVIVAKDLYKRYPGFPPVLRGVNIEVQPGEMVAIMGPSGCGKSTMLHILGMLHSPDSGELEILGQNVLAYDSEQTAAFRRGNMGFVMQASNLFEHSTVFENVEFPLIYENVPPQERWERVIRALDLVRLSSRVHYRSNRLSGGEQQRVAIARAMVNNPRILLADEPTGALDARTSAVIMENFRSLCHNGGVAMVMVTHDPKMADYCDSIYTLEDGTLHCQKHDPPKVTAKSAADFLKPPEPIVRGALVAWRFPAPDGINMLELARRLHSQGLLARIYALSRNNLLAGQEGYSLPLAVRRMGFWQRWLGRKFAPQKQGKGITADKLRAELPAHTGLKRSLARRLAFCCGSVLAGWSQADSIEFLYASGARKVAAATWVAARLMDLPFAFAVRAQDIPLLGPDCLVRGRDAAFITCATPAIATAFQKFAPDIPSEKLLVIPNQPRFASAEEEADSGPKAGKPAALLCLGPDSGKKEFETVLKAAAELKRAGEKFDLSVLGRPGLGIRLRILFSGLRRQVSFVGKGSDDRLADKFRNADIFIAWPPAGPGMDLAMPWQVCEAMALGLSIIALGISPGMAPLQADENCLSATDATTLAKAVKKALSGSVASLGEKAKKAIRTYLDESGKTRTLTDRIVLAAGNADRKREGQKSNGL